jgi:hypothetical protein
MQHAAHIAVQSLVNHLVLLHACLALKTFRHDLRGVVVSVAGQIPDADLGVGYPGLESGCNYGSGCLDE